MESSLQLRDLEPALLSRERGTWPFRLDLEESEALTRSSAFQDFPALFSPLFPPIDAALLATLTEAVAHLGNSLHLADDLMDGDLDPSRLTGSVLRCEALQFEAYVTLAALFPPGSPFWCTLRALLAEYAGACLAERELVEGARPWTDLTRDEAERIARGKSCVIRMPVIAMGLLAGTDDRVPALVRALDAYSVGVQMHDDVRDWKRDLATGFPSLLLVRALGRRPSAEDRADPAFVRDVSRRIFYGGHVQAVLDLGRAEIESAIRETDALPRCGFREVLQFERDRITALAADLDRIVAKNLDRTRRQPRFTWSPPRPRCESTRIGWKALGFVLDQWRLGFGEAQHILRILDLDARGTPSYYHADLFQRALIADALCDANEVLSDDLRPVLQYEADYLEASAMETPPGGWSYFPGRVQEPADSDDTGQVMQALLRCGRRDAVRRIAGPALEVLFRDGSFGDGSFATWIVPSRPVGAIQEKQAANATAYGGNRTCEVVANLLYALTLYDRDRFADEIGLGASYLERAQEPGGHWESHWYRGSLYGTFACLRLLASVAPASPAIPRGVRFLIRSQGTDGSWALDESTGDPLSTALALLALASVEEAHPGVAGEADLDAAFRSLGSRQEEDGGFPAVPFLLLPELQRDNSYASRTMTAAYVVKAVSTWQRIESHRSVPA